MPRAVLRRAAARLCRAAILLALATEAATGTAVATEAATGTAVAKEAATGMAIATEAATGTAVAMEAATGSAVATGTATGTAVATEAATGGAVATEAATGTDVAAPREAPPLLDAIALWLGANFDLPAPAQPPVLASLPEVALVAMRYGPEADVPAGTVAAVYDDAARTIYLAEGWTGRSPAELSILVHEMVHHLQAEGGMRFACPAERELLAYRAQEAWLGLFGESLQGAFGIAPAMLLVGTVCTH